MSNTTRETVYDIGGFFRVEHQPVPHRNTPYEFVKRIGAVTMLPILGDSWTARVLTIENKRYHYGTSVNLPAGNMDGGMENPELPAETAIRELREETGHGYPDGVEPKVSVYRLRDVSNTIDYPRFFAIMRGVSHIGGEEPSEQEQIRLMPMSLEAYVDPLFELERGETYPEINAAFAKARMELGRRTVLNWLADPTPYVDDLVADAFNPWLIRE